MNSSLKEVLYSLKRDILTNILIVIMLTLFFSVYVIIVSYYFDLPTQENVSDDNSYYFYQIPTDDANEYKELQSMMNIAFEDNNTPNAEHILNSLYELDNIDLLISNENSIGFPLSDLLSRTTVDGLEQFASNPGFSISAHDEYFRKNPDADYLLGLEEIYNSPRTLYLSSDYRLNEVAILSMFSLNQNAIDYFNLSTHSGRLFNENEYILSNIEGQISIVMGYNYSSLYSLDEIISVNHGGRVKSAKIIGFLEKDSYIEYIDRYSSEKITYLADNSVIAPSFTYNLDISEVNNSDYVAAELMATLYYGCGVIIPKGTSSEEFFAYQSQVKDIYINNGLSPVVFGEPTFGFLYFINDSNDTIELLLFIAIAMLIFDLLILYIFFRSKANKNMRRYAILIMNGWSIRSVITAFVIEIALLVLLPIVFISIIYAEQVINNLSFLILPLATALVLILLISTFISIKLRKLETDSLIRGTE